MPNTHLIKHTIHPTMDRQSNVKRLQTYDPLRKTGRQNTSVTSTSRGIAKVKDCLKTRQTQVKK